MVESKLIYGPAGIRVADLLSSKPDQYFLHGFEVNPDNVPYQFSDLRQGTQWQAQVARMLAFKPSVSTFLITPNDTLKNIYRPYGFVIGDGLVVAGTPEDAATSLTPDGFKDFHGHSEMRDIFSQQDIDVLQNKRSRYSEFAINNPIPMAWFIVRAPGADRLNPSSELINDKQIFEFIEQTLEFPVVIWEEGKMYPAVFDTTKQAYLPNYQGEFHLPTSKDWQQKFPQIKEKATNLILDDSPYSPFREGTPGYPETLWISAIEDGRLAFWQRCNPKYPLDLPHIKARRQIMDNPSPKLEPDEKWIAEQVTISLTNILSTTKAGEAENERILRCFYLWGIYDQAVIEADIAITEKIWSQLNNVYPYDKYNEIKERRLRPSGKIQLYRTDFPTNTAIAS